MKTSAKIKVPNEKPRLQRHGVAGWLETSLGHCFCGAEQWYAHIFSTTYDGSASAFEVCYPQCHSCFGSKSGQRAKTSYPVKHDHASARQELLDLIHAVTGKRPELEPGIQAYMYYGSKTMEIYPHLVNDYVWGPVTYWPEDRTVRLHATGDVLVYFPDDKSREGQFGFMSSEAIPVLNTCAPVDKAYKEYLWEHNHRQPMTDARGWLAWLIGEYLMSRAAPELGVGETHPSAEVRKWAGPIPGQRLTGILQEGIWHG